MASRTTSEQQAPNSFRAGPDDLGFFGLYGGRFVAETLMPLILELEKAYDEAKNDPGFQAELRDLLEHYGGRPSPLYFAERLTEHLKGAKIYFKRDELNHTGSHKINNCLGQIQLARRMGKTRIIAETGAGQHGVAVATVCARFGLPCEIYMGATDVQRQAPNVARMHMLGAKVNPVTGPVHVDGAAPGDALKITLHEFAPSGWGWTANIPGFGLLADQFKEPALHLWRYDAATLAPAAWGEAARVPLKPFVGTIGVALRESGTGEVMTFGPLNDSTVVTAVDHFAAIKWSAPATFSAKYTLSPANSTVPQWQRGPVMWIQVEDDNTNRILRVSNDGRNWKQLFSVGRTDFLTPDEAGIFVNSNNATHAAGILLLSWDE